MDNLYTVIVDYAGGTYISQVKASDEFEALKAWCTIFAAEESVPNQVRPIAGKVLANPERPVALRGLVSAWYCATVRHSRRLASINIVKTAEQ